MIGAGGRSRSAVRRPIPAAVGSRVVPAGSPADRLASGRWHIGRAFGDRRRSGQPRGDGGNAIVEFVFLGVLLLAPLMYLVLAVSAVQRNLYGVTQAAREAGRAYATGTAANAADRAGYAARLALEDQGVSGDGVVIRYGAVGAGCEAASAEPWPVTAGGEFAICVTRPFTVPGVPGFLVGDRSSVTGRYVVYLDRYRDYGNPAG
jgi:hypothetical protein